MKAKKRKLQEIKPLLPEVRKRLEKLYGDRLQSVILYGSFARNRADTDSDIDVAVVLKGKIQRVKELSKIGDALDDLMIETDELISVYPMTETELDNPVWPLYKHIREEGVWI